MAYLYYYLGHDLMILRQLVNAIAIQAASQGEHFKYFAAKAKNAIALVSCT